MAGYLNPIGSSNSVRVLPANRSLVTADSRYRNVNEQETESPYDFNANLSSGIVGKEILYQKLYWNQPLYSHNNTNNELFFQINNDVTTTYVVYATPFTIFNQYDGNPPGSNFQPPQPYSYADGMTQAFNGDVRLANANTYLINALQPHPGNLYDANGFQMTVQFLYSPSKGFVITFAPSVNPDIPVYSILLLPCNYIANAHFVHGFGIFDPASESTGYVPRNMWTTAYFSDDTPNLIPTRYITIRSSELTKDRRMISFQNANAARFQNELAIIALNPIYSGTFHTESVGDDSTVISKRDDYQPLTFRIQITQEDGSIIECDDPISTLLGLLTGVYESPQVAASYLPSGSNVNRGNASFMNCLLFTPSFALEIAPSPLPLTYTYCEAPLWAIYPIANKGGLSSNMGPFLNPPNQTVMTYTLYRSNPSPSNPLPPSSFFSVTRVMDLMGFGVSIQCPIDPGGTIIGTFDPSQYPAWYGLNNTWATSAKDGVYAVLAPPYNFNLQHARTAFGWDGSVNPTLGVSFTINFNCYGQYIAGVDNAFPIYFICFLMSPDYDGPPIAWAAPPVTRPLYITPGSYASVSFTHADGPWWFQYNPSFCIPGSPPFNIPQSVNIGFIAYYAYNYGANPNMVVQWNYGNTDTPAIPNPTIRFYTQKGPPPVYIPVEMSECELGNPQADALCEELIHEIAVVLDKN